jgi:hypothetical integral membrane protein (TIGR02206 family)
MERIFSPDNYNQFQLFSTSHIVAILIVLSTWIIFIALMKRVKNNKVQNIVKYFVAFLPLFFELSYILWNALTGQFSFAETLPFHLCAIFNILTVFIVLTENRLLLEIAYFIGVGGALQAIITPNMPQDFPHFVFIQLFAVHGLMILAVLYMIFVKGIIPRLKSIPKVFIIINLYLLLVYGINLITGGNYMFLMGPNPNPSLIDVLIDIFGQPPLHIIGLELIGLVNIFVFSIPLIIRKILIRNLNKEPLSVRPKPE